jgi:hypothetical protein
MIMLTLCLHPTCPRRATCLRAASEIPKHRETFPFGPEMKVPKFGTETCPHYVAKPPVKKPILELGHEPYSNR